MHLMPPEKSLALALAIKLDGRLPDSKRRTFYPDNRARKDQGYWDLTWGRIEFYVGKQRSWTDMWARCNRDGSIDLQLEMEYAKFTIHFAAVGPRCSVVTRVARYVEGVFRGEL